MSSNEANEANQGPERVESPQERAEDEDSARIVARAQAGESELFGTLYTRYFGRVLSYLSLLVSDRDYAEDLAQQTFTQAFEALPRYERRRQPFRAWLFTIARNCAVDHLAERAREQPVAAEELARLQDERAQAPPPEEEIDFDLGPLRWITDPELLMFVERLPLPQRQVLLLRYYGDLAPAEIGELLGRRDDDVRALQYRALEFLRKRLTALGRGPRGDTPDPPARMQRLKDKQNVLRARRYSLLQ